MTTIRDQIVDAVQRYPGRSTDELIALLGMESAQVISALQGARKHQRIWCKRRQTVFVWFESGYNPDAQPKPEYINRFDGPPYTCPELRVEPARPGAIDAYKLKSRGIG